MTRSPFDVGRQRHFTEFRQSIQNIRRRGEAQPPMAFVVLVDHDRAFAAVVALKIEQTNFRSDSRAFSGTYHRPPIVRRVLFEQQQFKLSAAASVDAAK